MTMGDERRSGDIEPDDTGEDDTGGEDTGGEDTGGEDHARVGTWTVDAARAGTRLDRLLVARVPDLSRSRMQALIATGRATVNGATVTDAGHKVRAGDAVGLAVPAAVAPEPVGEVIPLAVAYEDDALIVIDKPAGLVVHPAAGNESGTLVNALIAHCGDSLSGIGGVKRPGIVHRLDKDTTGLMVVAKTDAAHAGLAAQFAAHGRDGRLERRYTALVWGRLPQPVGTIDAPLARSTVNRTRMQVVGGRARGRIGQGGTWLDEDEDGPPGARDAVTHYRVVATFDSAGAPGRPGAPLASLVHVELETGRTHQIRVHMAHIGHPVLGDPTYGAGFKSSERRLSEPQATALHALGRQALHAAVLGIEHPITGEPMRFESPLPADMDRLVGALRGTPPAPSPPTRSRRKPR
jgi:23S rRNA pseudouridine1911/1915/1917 synthase